MILHAEKLKEKKDFGVEPTVNTKQAAALLGRAPKTLRTWSMTGEGPVQPIRTGYRGPLMWRLSDIRNLIGGGDHGE